MAIQTQYDGDMDYISAIPTALISLVGVIQKLTAAPCGEAAHKYQEVWQKIQSVNLVMKVACKKMEADISDHQHNLVSKHQYYAALHQQLRVATSEKDNLAVKKAGFIEEKQVLQKRQSSLEENVQACQKNIKETKTGFVGLVSFATITGVTAIVAAPFSGGISLLALGVTSCTVGGAITLSGEYKELNKQKEDVVTQIDSIENAIRSINQQIDLQSELIKNLENTLENIQNDVFRSDVQLKLLGKKLTVIQNAKLSLKAIERSCNNLQEDIEFIQGLIQQSSISREELADLVKHSLSIETYIDALTWK